MLKILGFATTVLFLVFAVNADYVQTVDVYDYSVGGNITWNHTYDFSVVSPVDVTLTIVADDVDGIGNGFDGEQDAVYINSVFLGYLEQLPSYTNWNYQPGPGNSEQGLTTTVFSLASNLLDWTMPINISVESSWGVEIETSTLTVASAANVPEPATYSMLAFGLFSLALFFRRKK